MRSVVGGGIMNGKSVAVDVVQYNTQNIAYKLIDNKENVIGLVKMRF